jgi:hypothetical protein
MCDSNELFIRCILLNKFDEGKQEIEAYKEINSTYGEIVPLRSVYTWFTVFREGGTNLDELLASNTIPLVKQ